jgi:hypothetical protein
MKRFLIAALVAMFVVGVVSVPGAYAGGGNPSPSGTGPPSQECVGLVESGTGALPGHAAESPGSPFNEPELTGGEGGIGGQNYNEMSQYDVACFHQP